MQRFFDHLPVRGKHKRLRETDNSELDAVRDLLLVQLRPRLGGVQVRVYPARTYIYRARFTLNVSIYTALSTLSENLHYRSKLLPRALTENWIISELHGTLVEKKVLPP